MRKKNKKWHAPLRLPSQKKDRFTVCVERVLKHEGGKSNHKDDKGGKTNYGISQYIFKVMRRDGLTEATDVYDITRKEAISAYKKYFWDDYKCGFYEKGLDYFIFDVCINHSPAGFKEITADDPSLPYRTYPSLDTLYTNRQIYYRRIVRNDRSQAVFLKGWLRRAEEVYKQALLDKKSYEK